MVVALIRNSKKKFRPIGCDWVAGRYIYLNVDKVYVSDPTYLTFVPEIFSPNVKELEAQWEQV